MYLKRQKVPKIWPTERKGTKYVVRANSHLREGIPLLVVVRDMLKLAQNRKEVRKAIHSRQVLLNGRKIKDEKNAVLPFDLVSILSRDGKVARRHRLEFSENGKFVMVDFPDEADRKVAKVTNKKILKGGKMQINLGDGRNVISDLKCSVNDSVVLDLKDNKIEKCLPLKEGSPVVIREGKYLGSKGTVKKINPENKIVVIDSGGREINVLIKQMMVVEK